ncbi:MAG TPA: HEAT repeat domain-containing protein [Nitrospinota bacterium]|nr:HEAT repeat domain-containing protein [Nitrospinota bacterium]
MGEVLEKQDIAYAKNIIDLFLKARDSQEIHNGKKEVSSRIIDEIYQEFSRILTLKEKLNFGIKGNRIEYDSEPVYASIEKKDNLALFFFNDGIREISFKKGLTKEETKKFVKIVSTDFDSERKEDDVVTILWEKNFQHIGYVVDEAYMTRDEQKDIEKLVDRLGRAKKVFRMYAENNPVHSKIINDLYEILSDFLNIKDVLRLHIEQNKIFFKSKEVYTNPERQSNLALFFFRDGIRQLSFKKGLTLKELRDFLKIISFDFDVDKEENDLVTLMWEKEFQHITYYVDENFLSEGDDFEEKAVSELKKTYIEQEEKDFKIQKKPIKEEDGEEVLGIEISPLTDKDYQYIALEVEKSSRDKTERLMNTALGLFHATEDASEYKDIENAIKNTINYTIETSKFNIVIRFLERLREDYLKKEEKYSFSPHLSNIVYHLSSEKVIDLIGQMFDREVQVDEETKEKFISLLDKRAIIPLAKKLADLKSITATETFLHALTVLGKQDIDALAEGLNNENWFVVKNIISILREIGDKDALGRLKECIGHSDKRIRREAIKILAKLSGNEALETIKKALEDEDPFIRSLAIKSLEEIDSQESKRIILEKIQEKDFPHKSYSDKKGYFQILSKTKDPEIKNLLLKIFKKRSLFKGAMHNDTKAVIAYYFGNTQFKEALPYLNKLKNSRHKLLRTNVNIAIRKIKNG